MRRFLSVLCLMFLFCQSHADPINHLTSPPHKLPVIVYTDFFLLDLINIDEKNQTFSADVYFLFKWQDSRLAFSSDVDPKQPQVFLNESAEDKLKEIWWPQIEFINGGTPIFNNRALFIFPDGTIEYHIGITGDFRTEYDFKNFPFDSQVLQIMIDSFLWDLKVVEFVPLPHRVRSHLGGSSEFEDERIVELTETTSTVMGPVSQFFGGGGEYSTYVVSMKLMRRSGFFLYQVFLPLLLVMGIACTVFFAYKEPFLDRIMLSLTSFLVFLAAKFTINQDLPHIDYMTKVDKSFVLSYIFIGVTVVVSVLHKLWIIPQEERARKLDYHARWAVPLTYVVLLACMLWFN